MSNPIAEIADRLERAADRYQNAGDLAGEQAARNAAGRIRQSPTVEQALAIERAFFGARIPSPRNHQQGPDNAGCLGSWGRTTGGTRVYGHRNRGWSAGRRTGYVHSVIVTDTYAYMTMYEMMRHQHPEWSQEQLDMQVEQLSASSGVPADAVVGTLEESQLGSVASAIATNPSWSASDALPDIAPGAAGSDFSDAGGGGDYGTESSDAGGSGNYGSDNS